MAGHGISDRRRPAFAAVGQCSAAPASAQSRSAPEPPTERGAVEWRKVEGVLRFSELVRKLEGHGFRLLSEKGSVRYYRKQGHDRLIRVDYHGPKEVPAGTCHAILKAAGIKPGVEDD